MSCLFQPGNTVFKILLDIIDENPIRVDRHNLASNMNISYRIVCHSADSSFAGNKQIPFM